MKISICISTYRGADRLRKLLPTIAATDDRALETVVFDDGSPVEDGARIKDAIDSGGFRPDAIWLARSGENRGYAQCMRDAIDLTTGEVVLLLDDDTLLPRDLLPMLRMLMAALPNVGVLSWRSEGTRPGQSQRAIAGMLQPATQLASYCYAFTRKVWDEVGGFDTRFRFFTIDSDFCVRATLAGHPCYRAWWPLVPHLEHGGIGGDTVPFSREAIAKRDMMEFHAKWGCNPDEMERRALASLEERAK